MTTESTDAEINANDLRRLLREATKEVQRSRIPILIATLAACLALVSMADGEAGKRAMVAHIESANQFAYFQAKNIRKTDSEIAAAMFERLGHPELAAKWGAKASRYDDEKTDILNSAKAEQVKRETAIRQGEYFSVAIALLQISIVLASASLILAGGMLLISSILLGCVAAIFTVNGYGLYWQLPTEPSQLAAWVMAMM